MKFLQCSLVGSVALLLVACGGGSSTSTTPFVRGSLIDAPQVLATLTAAQIDAGVAAGISARLFPPSMSALSYRAKCSVQVVALNYRTPGARGEDSNASAVMLVPGSDPSLSTSTCAAASSSALVAYARGTQVERSRTLADPADGETFLLAAIYAAQGYTVVATEYLGYARSTYAYHPYLHADSEATAIIDSIRAARRAAASLSVTLSGKLMLTGYSQGGHASMAAHRAAERDNASEMTITAGAHLAGPYNLSGEFRSPVAIQGYQIFIPFAITAWQQVYGNAYARVGDVFKAPYADTIERLLPSATLDSQTLISTGKLPDGTPAQARDALMQAAFLADLQNNPANSVVLAAQRNDLLGWSPQSTMLLCGGAGDPVVRTALHFDAMKTDLDARGASVVNGLMRVTAVDVDAQVQALYAPGGVAPTDPLSAEYAVYFDSYHGVYEPPLCHLQARALFDTVR